MNLIYRIRIIYRLLIQYGIVNGITIFIKIKLNHTNSIKIKNIKHQISLRHSTTDIPLFYDIFVFNHYSIKVPGKVHKIIDAGSNIGLSTIFFANRFPDAQIICLEPDPGNFEMLKTNTQNYPNIININKALWNKQSSIKVVDNNVGCWGYTVEENNNSKEELFNSLSINDLIIQYNIKQIDLLKIDIEGSEKEVFENNFQSWLGITKCLIIEVHDNIKIGSSKAVFNAVSKFNFKFSMNSENLIFINNDLI